MARLLTRTARAARMSRTRDDESYYLSSQWQLMWRKFKRHRLATAGLAVLAVLYVSAAFAEFFAPYDIAKRYPACVFCPPQRIHFFADGRLHLRPFVYPLAETRDPVTLRRTYTEDRSRRLPLRLLVRGDEYELWNLIPGDRHLFGVGEGEVAFLFGTDQLGRDLFSRNLHAARISLTIGLVGVADQLRARLRPGGHLRLLRRRARPGDPARDRVPDLDSDHSAVDGAERRAGRRSRSTSASPSSCR